MKPLCKLLMDKLHNFIIIKVVNLLESEIFKLAASQGIWSALTVILIFYILKAQERRDSKQEEREKNYQSIISSLTEKLNLVQDVKKDMELVKDNLEDIKIKIIKKN